MTRNDTRNISSKYDFMIAISGSSTIGGEEEDQLRDLISKEFNKFLLNTTLPTLAFIVVIVLSITLYAHCKVSRGINNLAEMLDKPQDPGNKVRIKALSEKGAKLNEAEQLMLDEIERLEYIFAHFFNEEKYRVKQDGFEHGDRKKVQMLPMKTTRNIFRDTADKIDKVEILNSLLTEDLNHNFDLINNSNFKDIFKEPNAN